MGIVAAEGPLVEQRWKCPVFIDMGIISADINVLFFFTVRFLLCHTKLSPHKTCALVYNVQSAYGLPRLPSQRQRIEDLSSIILVPFIIGILVATLHVSDSSRPLFEMSWLIECKGMLMRRFLFCFCLTVPRRRRKENQQRRQRTTFTSEQTLKLELEYQRTEYITRPRR